MKASDILRVLENVSEQLKELIATHGDHEVWDTVSAPPDFPKLKFDPSRSAFVEEGEEG